MTGPRIRVFALLLCAALAGAWLSAQQQEVKPAADPPMIDTRGFQELLAKHRGKPVMIYFWATWCPPCREEFPMVNELAKKYAPQGLVVVGVSFDEDAEMNLVRRFLGRNNPVFSNYRKKAGYDPSFYTAVKADWKGAIPASFFYAADGRQVAHLMGENKREAFEKPIQALLEGSRKPDKPEPASP